MASTAAERKADEVRRKAEQGLKRRSYWIDGKTIEVIENYKLKHGLKSNDEAINMLIQSIETK